MSFIIYNVKLSAPGPSANSKGRLRLRKSKEEAARTRRRIVEAAAGEFREHGLEATSLSALMSAAGLTHGGFYRHFESKEAAAAEALAAAVDQMTREVAAAAKGKSGAAARVAILKRYLSPQHLKSRRNGCPLAALGSELSHAGEPARATAARGFEDLVEIVSSLYPRLEKNAARQQAIAIVSGMIGALTMARVIADSNLAEEVLESAASALGEL